MSSYPVEEQHSSGQLLKTKNFFRQQRLSDIEAKKVQKEAAFAEKETKKAAKEAAEGPEREALDKIRAEEKSKKLDEDNQHKEGLISRLKDEIVSL